MLRSVLVAVVGFAPGCSGLVDAGGDEGAGPDAATARRLWLSKALPVLNASCAECHGGSMPGIDYMAGASDFDKRDRLLAHVPTVVDAPPITVDLDSPSSSYLVTRGAHDGPALDASQTSDILEWIAAEKKAAGVETVIIGVRLTPAICVSGLPDTPAAPNPNCLVNRVVLDEVGATGATIDFVLQSLGDGIYLSNLNLVPGASGALIDHPLFVTFPATLPETLPSNCTTIADETFCADPIDRFAALKKNLMAGAPAEPLGDGTGTFDGFVATDDLRIQFREVGVFTP